MREMGGLCVRNIYRGGGCPWNEKASVTATGSLSPTGRHSCLLIEPH